MSRLGSGSLFVVSCSVPLELVPSNLPILFTELSLGDFVPSTGFHHYDMVQAARSPETVCLR